MESTIIYYTSNREKESFEQKVIDTIKKSAGDRPIISVSQKPIDLGKNICVGVHDQCYRNQFLQIRIALEEVKTPFVTVTESDCLYPPSYFSFEPTERGVAYRYNNVWVHYTQYNGRPKFWFKYMSDCAQMIDRDLWLEKINSELKPGEPWATTETGGIPNMQFRAKGKWQWGGEPVITFKTLNGQKSNTVVKRGLPPKYALPYWGDAIELRKLVGLVD